MCSIYQIFQYGNHSVDCLNIIEDADEVHPDAQFFGIHPRVKLIIQNLLANNPSYYSPQQISLYLNQKHIKETSMKGLIIPDRESISHFLRSVTKDQSKFLSLKDDVNDNVDLENDHKLENVIESNQNENSVRKTHDENLNKPVVDKYYSNSSQVKKILLNLFWGIW
jgi:hypothetical protein